MVGDEPPNREGSQDSDRVLSSRESETIRAELKEVRARILRELYNHDGEVSSTYLRSETGANVPTGSLNHHLMWLQGNSPDGTPLQWWPDGAPALVQVARREDRGHSSPTKIIGLTEAGEEIAEQIISEGMLHSKSSVDEIRTAAKAHGNQIQSLADSVEENAADIESLEEQAGTFDDRVEDFLEHVEELHGRIDELEQRVDA